MTLPDLDTIFNAHLLVYVAVGFGAQLIDGSLGMAYGISSNTFLVSLGLPPATASASVHIAETFITGISGYSHWKFKNVNKRLLWALVVPGVLGVVLGAYILTEIDGKIVKPFVAAYLFLMGLIILRKSFLPVSKKSKTPPIYPLAFVGGFLDAIGGGGWGPVVVSTLMNSGRDARYIIGTVNLSEFFISLAGAGTFLILIQISNWQAVVGLLLGGCSAAPFAAWICARLNPKYFMAFVGTIILVLSGKTLWLALGQ
jgi:uncharacterized membrane protein YfcA